MKEAKVRPPAVDRLASWIYLLLTRVGARIAAKTNGIRHSSGGPLGLLFLGHGMNHHGSIEYQGTPLETVESWLEESLGGRDLNLSSFRRGEEGGFKHFANAPWQNQVVYRDNLIHFFATLNILLASERSFGGFPGGLSSLAPFYHSSGVYSLVYVVGAASLEDSFRITAKGPDLFDEEEEIRSGEDLERFLPILSSSLDLDRKAVSRMRQHVSTVLKGVPGIIEAFDQAVERRGAGLGTAMSELVRRAIRARLVALSGFGVRPYTVEDAERLVAACRERGLAVEVSVVNNDNMVLLGGPSYDLAVAEVLAREGACGRRPFLISKVLVDGAPHTSRYRNAARRWRAFLDDEIRMGKLRDPVIPFMGRDSTLVKTAAGIRDELTGTLDKPFLFRDACRSLLEMQPRMLIAAMDQNTSPGHNVVEAAVLDQSRILRRASPLILKTGDLIRGGSEIEHLRKVLGTGLPGQRPCEPMSYKRLDALRQEWESCLAGLRRPWLGLDREQSISMVLS